MRYIFGVMFVQFVDMSKSVVVFPHEIGKQKHITLITLLAKDKNIAFASIFGNELKRTLKWCFEVDRLIYMGG